MGFTQLTETQVVKQAAVAPPGSTLTGGSVVSGAAQTMKAHSERDLDLYAMLLKEHSYFLCKYEIFMSDLIHCGILNSK